MSTQVAELVARLRADTSGYVAGMTQAETSLSRVEQRHQQVAAGLSTVGGAVTRYVSLPMAAAAVVAVKSSADFGVAFARIEGLAGVPHAAIAGLRDDVLSLAGSTAQAPQDLANAMYFITSAGIDAAHATDVLRASAQASTAGLGNVADVSYAVVSAVNAYSKTHLTAAAATDVMVATTKAATFEADQLAQTMGRVIPISAQMGVGFDQVGAALAAMSQGGLDADQATTALRGILVQVLNPSQQAVGLWQKMFGSLDNVRQVLREKGLLGLLETMTTKLHGNEAAIAQLFPDVRGLVGALNLLGQDQQKLHGIFADTAQSAGDTSRAFDIMKDTVGFQLKQAVADLKVAFVQLGDTGAPAVQFLANAVSIVANAVSGAPDPVRRLILTVVTLLGVLGPALLLAGAFARSWAAVALVFGESAAASGAMTVAATAQAGAEAEGAIATTAATAARHRKTLADIEQLAVYEALGGAQTALNVADLEQLQVYGALTEASTVRTAALGEEAIALRGTGAASAAFGPVGMAIAGITAAVIALHIASKQDGGIGGWLSGAANFHIPGTPAPHESNVDNASIKTGAQFASSVSVTAESASKLNAELGEKGVQALHAYQAAVLAGATGTDRFNQSIGFSIGMTEKQNDKFISMTVGIDEGVAAMGPAERATVRLGLAQQKYADDVAAGAAGRAALPADLRELAVANAEVKRIQDAVTAALGQGASATGASASATGAAAGKQSAFQAALAATGQQLDDVTIAAGVKAAGALERMGLSGAWAAGVIQQGMSAAAIAVGGLLSSIQAGLAAESANDSLAQSLDSLDQAQKGVGASAGGMGGATKTAAQIAFDAEQKQLSYRDSLYSLADAQQAVQQAQLDAGRAAEDMQTAIISEQRSRESIIEAVNNETAARQHLNEILHGETAGSKDAVSARKEVRDSLARLQASQIGAQRAQQRLAELQKSGKASALDIREAQVALQQAQFEVADATQAHRDAVSDLDHILHGFSATSEEAKEAQKQLRDAHRGVQDAEDRLRGSTRGVQDAYIHLGGAGRDVARAQAQVVTADYNVRRSLADLRGELDSATRSGGGFRNRALEIHSAGTQAKNAIYAWAQKQADLTGATQGSKLWTDAFYQALLNLKNMLHPTGELASFMDGMILKFYALAHPPLAPANPLPSRPSGPGSVNRGPYASGGIARGPLSGFTASLHGIEAVVPLGPGHEADRSRVMLEATRIAPDLAGGGGYAGSEAPAVAGAAPGESGVFIAEMHNHFLRNDRDMLDRVSTVERRTGRKVVTR